MVERPTIFSAHEVRAILAGTKTQTRRLVQPMAGRQREWLTLEKIGRVPHGEMVGGGWKMHHYHAGTRFDGLDIPHDEPLGWIRSPFGESGDRLWVKETHAIVLPLDSGRTEYDGARMVKDDAGDDREVWYRADGELGVIAYAFDDGPRWRPSIHMPRWASRITLEVTGVRVERLQDITEKDALAEGMVGVPFVRDDGFPLSTGYMAGPDDGKTSLTVSAREAFAQLWDSINGKRATWESNPYVWVVGFRRVT